MLAWNFDFLFSGRLSLKDGNGDINAPGLGKRLKWRDQSASSVAKRPFID
jgi:hypothetical protein